MVRQSFIYANPYSSIDVRTVQAKDSWPEWLEIDFERGYLLTGTVASFATSTDDTFSVEVVESDEEDTPADCVTAVLAPLLLESIACIRGGGPDVDIPLDAPVNCVAFYELSGSRILIRLSHRVLDAPSLIDELPC